MGIYTNKSIISNSSFLIGQRLYTMLLSMVMAALTARYLGPDNYGTISYSASFVALFTVISRMGMEEIVVHDVVENEDKTSIYIGSAVFIRFISSFAFILLTLLVEVLTEPAKEELFIITLIQSTVLIFNTYEVFGYWYQSKMKSKILAVATMISSTVTALCRIAFLVLNKTVFWFATITAFQALVCLIVLCVMYFFRYKQKIKVDFITVRSILIRSVPFILSGIAITIYTHTDRIMVGKMLGEAEAGFYSIAAAIAVLWEFIPLAIINPIRPAIYDMKLKSGTVKHDALLKLLFLITTALAISIGIFFNIFSSLIVGILYGSEYMAAEAPLKVLIWATGISTCGTIRSIWFVSENKMKYAQRYAIVGAVLNVVLNYFLIKLIGIVGAAYATLITESVCSFLLPFIFSETLPYLKIYVSAIIHPIKTIKEYMNIAH